jgi:hypothetical protein
MDRGFQLARGESPRWRCEAVTPSAGAGASPKGLPAFRPGGVAGQLGRRGGPNRCESDGAESSDRRVPAHASTCEMPQHPGRAADQSPISLTSRPVPQGPAEAAARSPAGGERAARGRTVGSFGDGLRGGHGCQARRRLGNALNDAVAASTRSRPPLVRTRVGG